MTRHSAFRYVTFGLVLSLSLTITSTISVAPATAQIIDNANYVHPDEFRKRAEKGDEDAMLMLQNEVIRFKNPKKKKDPEKFERISKEERLKWIRAGAAAGEPNSQARLARILGKGSSVPGGYARDDFSTLVPLDYAESARLARAAAIGFRQADAGSGFNGIRNREALDKAADDLEDFAQQSEDLGLLLPLAEAGDVDAIWGVYLVHAAAHNNDEIWHWLSKSVKAGDPRAIVETWRRQRLSSNYNAWENGKPNDWLVMAARLGNPDAMSALGSAYAWHLQDYETAVEWFRKADAAGAPFAEVSLYLYGDPKARGLARSANAGDGRSAYQLAQYYLTGDWDGRNTGEYERWMRKAVDLRHTDALWEWGKRTDNASLIRAAANAGHAEARAEVTQLDRRAAEERRRLQAEATARVRGEAEAIYAILRSGNTYNMNGISHERLYAAL